MYALVLMLAWYVLPVNVELCQSPVPSRQEVQGLLDIFTPLLKPFVEQWKRTNDLLEDSREELRMLRSNAADNLKVYIIGGSVLIGVFVGSICTWFVFSLKHDRKLKQHEERFYGSTVDLS